eukprot:1271156-Rhodomonas_salina.2
MALISVSLVSGIRSTLASVSKRKPSTVTAVPCPSLFAFFLMSPSVSKTNSATSINSSTHAWSGTECMKSSTYTSELGSAPAHLCSVRATLLKAASVEGFPWKRASISVSMISATNCVFAQQIGGLREKPMGSAAKTCDCPVTGCWTPEVD